MSHKFSVVVAGSRDFQNYQLLKATVSQILSAKLLTHSVEIVSGTCRGADKLGERFAKEFGLSVREFPADWDKHGRAAGPIRNRQMAEYADAVIVFLPPNSRGSKSMMTIAGDLGKPLRVICIDDDGNRLR